MFLVIPVRKGPEVMKNWHGAKIAVKTWTFADLFDHFSSGAVDKMAPLKDVDKYTLNVTIGQKKTELTQLSPDVLIGEAVPCLGNFVDFSLLENANAIEITDTNTKANDQLCWGLTTRQPLWVILCRLPEKGRKRTEEIAEEMKERDREERGTGIKVKKQKK